MPTPDSDTDVHLIIDALVLGRNGARRHYEFRGRRFGRLRDVLASDQPALDLNLHFSLQKGKVAVKGELAGAVELICQRCLKEMSFSLEEHFALLISGKAQVEGHSGSMDDSDVEYQSSQWEDWVADATELDVTELVEEQVLLAVPLIARHEDPQLCNASVDTLLEHEAALGNAGKMPVRAEIPIADVGGAEPRRPFANLRELLKK